MKRINIGLGILLLALAWSGAAMAATCTSIASGNWSSASTWTCVGAPVVTIPGATDTAIIASPNTVTLNNSVPVVNLTVNAGGVLVDNNGTRTLTITGNLTVDGAINNGGGRVQLNVTGNNSVISGSGTIDSARLYTSGTSVTVAAGSSLTFTGNSRIYAGQNSGGATVAGSVLTINGTINSTVAAGTTDFLRLYANNTVIGTTGAINAPTSSVTYNTNAATVTNNGSVDVTRITQNAASNSWTQGINSSLTVSSVSTVGTLNASASGNTVTYNGTSTVIAPSAAGYWNLAGTIFPGACPVAYTISGSNPCGPGAPTVTTDAATALATTGATLNGRVSSNGASTTVTFDYGLTTGYGSTATATASPLAVGAVNTAVTKPITGLTCGTLYHFRAKGVNSYGTTNGADRTFTTSACPPAPAVTSINTASPNPTAANTVVTWTVLFNDNMAGVDLFDFTLVSAGGVAGASLTSISGSGTTYTVTANTGTGTVGTLTLRLVDDDSIINAVSTPLGGAGAGNGNFTGQAYTLIIPVCTPGLLFCDDFERSVVVGGSNTAGSVGTAPAYGAWTVAPLAAGCAGVAGNRGCAGIDSDVPPWSTATNPRANATRAMFTRWRTVTVTSPVIDLSAKTGARISFWLRRGSDCFSEWPGNQGTGCGGTPPLFTPTAGEEFQVQYLNNLGVWIVLAQYPTDDTPGEIIVPVIELPEDALHAGFRIRFSQPGGSGNGGSAGAPGVLGYDYWHVDNVVLEEVPAVLFPGPLCDTFEGDLSRWVATGIGNVRIGSTHFQNGAHNMDLRWNAVSATTRKIDLSANSGNNTISFWVKRGTGIFTQVPNTTGSEFPDTVAKGLKFEYLNNLGAWVQLGTTFPGSGTQGQIFSPTLTPLTNSFAIPADAKHANFKLRISLLAGSGLLDQDYWHVDDVCIGATIDSTDLGMSMTSSGTFSPGQYVTYTMTVTNNGLNTDPGPITITDTLPTGLTYASGSAGWACGAAGQVVTCTQTGGLAPGTSTVLTLTATVDATASGTITNTATVGGQANDTALANNTATKTDTIFVPGYVFTNRACDMTGVPIDSGAQCSTITWSPQTAGTPLGNVYITAVNAANVPIQLHATNPTTVNVQFGLSCFSPVANAGVQATFYDAATTTLPLCEANGATPTTWSAARALSFPAATSSVGPFSFNYNDVGTVELFMRNSAVTTQMGRSGTFVVKPAGFVLSAIKCTTADAANCGAGALAMGTPGDNPAAANAVGVTFIRAGYPFSVTVTAVNALGNPTPNFGKEAVPETVKLTPNNAVAGMAVPPVVGGTFGAFTAGVATGTVFTWSEVGIITLTPSVGDGNYLGAGDVTGSISGNVGRFYPAYFNTVVTQVSGVPMSCPGGLTPACPTLYSGIVYSGQPFSLTVTAKNVSDVTTVNYNTTTGFAKSTALSAFGVLGTTTTPTGAGTLGVASVTAFAAGTLTEAAEKYTFTTTPTPPTNIYIRASDGEASSLRLINPTTTSVEGGVAVVSGHIKISNAHGSELLPLPMTATVQYYNGITWITSATDNATSFNSNLDTNPGGNLVAVIVSGLTGGGVAVSNPGTSAVVAGARTFRLTALGGQPGSATISLNAPSYLPSNIARVTFGVYKGSNEIIYIRENY